MLNVARTTNSALWTGTSGNWSGSNWDRTISGSSYSVGLDDAPAGVTQTVTVDTSPTLAAMYFGGSGNWTVNQSGGNSISLGTANLIYACQGSTTIGDNVIGSVGNLVVNAGSLTIGQFGSSSTNIYVNSGTLTLTGASMAVANAYTGYNSGGSGTYFWSNPTLALSNGVTLTVTNAMKISGTLSGPSTGLATYDQGSSGSSTTLTLDGVLAGNLNIGDSNHTIAVAVSAGSAIFGLHNISGALSQDSYGTAKTPAKIFDLTGNVALASLSGAPA